MLGIPSCSDDDREFAVRHGLQFADVYDAEKSHIVNSDQVCNNPDPDPDHDI